jgi:hypothetical protein
LFPRSPVGDFLHGFHEIVHALVQDSPEALVERGIYIPSVRVGAAGDVLVLNCDRDIPFEPAFLDLRLKVPELVSVADDSGAGYQGGYALLEEGQI